MLTGVQHKFTHFILPLAIFVAFYVVYDSFILQGSISSVGNSNTQHYSRLEFDKETSVSKEKISLRVNIVDSGVESFQKFILHYTECNTVHNVLLLPLKQAENVAHTVKLYRKVKWLKSAQDTTEIGSNNAVLVLDSDILIPCSDLEFAYSVWLSARDSAVGFFPRLVLDDKNGRFEYLGPMYVWWQGIYSLMSPAGMLIRKSMLDTFYDQSNLMAQAVHNIGFTNPSCAVFSISVWSVYVYQSPPVWADVDVSYIPIVKAVSTYGDRTYSKATECVNIIASALNIRKFTYSSHRAAKAKNQLFW